MEKTKKTKTAIEQAGEDLSSFAVDRQDIKEILDLLPAEAKIKPATVEYELQILKIILVGWSISCFLENKALKEPLAEQFWLAIREFSWSLSETAGLMTGHKIDYFQVLKERLDMYVAAMDSNSAAPEPAAVIGPEFARACGNVDDVFTVIAGARMCVATLESTREYLRTLEGV